MTSPFRELSGSPAACEDGAISPLACGTSYTVAVGPGARERGRRVRYSSGTFATFTTLPHFTISLLI